VRERGREERGRDGERETNALRLTSLHPLSPSPLLEHIPARARTRTRLTTTVQVPTGKRYCINGVSLVFKPSDAA
jgi:hypothetical protein